MKHLPTILTLLLLLAIFQSCKESKTTCVNTDYAHLDAETCETIALFESDIIQLRKARKKAKSESEQKQYTAMIDTWGGIVKILASKDKPSKKEQAMRDEMKGLDEIKTTPTPEGGSSSGPSQGQIDCAKNCFSDRLRCEGTCPEGTGSDNINCMAACWRSYFLNCCRDKCGNIICWGIRSPI